MAYEEWALEATLFVLKHLTFPFHNDKNESFDEAKYLTLESLSEDYSGFKRIVEKYKHLQWKN